MKVKLVDVRKFIGGVVLKVSVLLPRLIALVLVFVEFKAVAVTLKLFVVNVPLVTVIDVVVVRASCNVQVAVDVPEKPKLTVCNDFPAVVTVKDPLAA